MSVRDAFIAFHKQWYSASIMRLVVLGRESLDGLEAMVADRFAAVPNNGVARPTYIPPGTPEEDVAGP